ncbi:monovalent cation/H(+) antiporter subunit G [Herbiconiux sp. CPCC 205763]|uniref:Monovalent cation/H(+) antiporter subunit G n=1 Tax=Herbiconiux aconitum TaxID=2970913 RepID=A0ABT2GLX1_9MICO|nr:monovalent cation/H(+) antiporter subunit G [Herbiconiux aconitum]MCS5717232.1 monovalent cation/H(+) antiporter subunit G [Herbiconiux aconitum]
MTGPLDLGFDFDLRDVITSVLVLLAAVMCFAAGVGLLRFPDVLSRLHAATKPQILGIIAIVADVAVTNPSVGTITLALAIIFFQSLTAPVSAHMVGRAAYRSGHFRADTLLVDELKSASDTGTGPHTDRQL